MNELVNIELNNGIPVVSSREVAERFEKKHKHVLEKISTEITRFNSAENSAQYFITSEYTDVSGKKNIEYLLTRDGFSLLVMGFTGEKAFEWKLKYIDAFNKMETQLRSQAEKMLPTTYKEALIQLLEQVEQNEKLLAENQVLTPKAEYHDEVLNKDGLLTTSMIAKDAGLKSATALNRILFTNGVIYKDKDGIWKPYAKYEWLIKEGYCDYRSYAKENVKPSLKWTEKGRKWIIEHLQEFIDNDDKVA